MRIPKFICCITRMLLNSHNMSMTACQGEQLLHDTHCRHCEYWAENQYIFEDETMDEEEEEEEE